jgi:hypothetical protein
MALATDYFMGSTGSVSLGINLYNSSAETMMELLTRFQRRLMGPGG